MLARARQQLFAFARTFRPDSLPKWAFIATALCAMGTHAQSQSSIGSWANYDWQNDTASLETPSSGLRQRLIHGALIPQGPYRGCVLTWGRYENVTHTFLWDPSNPTRLFQVLNTWGAGVDRDMDGVSLTWDEEGQLVIVAPAPAATSPSATSEVWRIFPGSLNYPPLETAPGTPPSQWFAHIGGSAFRQAPSMSVARFRPAMLLLMKGLVSGTVADRSTFVLGGMASVASNDGWEFWQTLSPRTTSGGSTWDATFVPDIAHAHTDPAPKQLYVVQGSLTETQIEATPGVFQLASAGPAGPSVFTKSMFVAQDSLVTYDSPPVASNSQGRTSIVRPRYGSTPNTWEQFPATIHPFDRSQGAAILRHDRSGGTPSYDGTNRVMCVGGMTFSAFYGRWVSVSVFAEYRVPMGATPNNGNWVGHPLYLPNVPTPADVGQVNNSAVVLPTGDILVVGGGSLPNNGQLLNNVPASGVPLAPSFAPLLVRPGPVGALSSTWGLNAMATVPTSPTYNNPAPRLFGHAAVLLIDGRVLVTGGDTSAGGQPGLSFTGDIFSPPYLHQSFRPTIVSMQGSTFSFGDAIPLAVGHTSPELIDAVVLVRPAATAFGMDAGQRYIELDFTLGTFDGIAGIQDLTATAPADDLGPQGYYMLFVVTHLASEPANRVPSIGQFIYLK